MVTTMTLAKKSPMIGRPPRKVNATEKIARKIEKPIVAPIIKPTPAVKLRVKIARWPEPLVSIMVSCFGLDLNFICFRV